MSGNSGGLLTAKLFRYLYENLEAIFIATWLVSLVVLIIVTLKNKNTR